MYICAGLIEWGGSDAGESCTDYLHMAVRTTVHLAKYDFKGVTVPRRRDDLMSLTLGKRNPFVQWGQCCSNIIICTGMWNIIRGPSLALMAAGLIPPEKHLQSNKSNKEFVQLNCSEIHSRSERKTTNQPAMNVYRWKKAIKPIKVNIKHDLLCQYTLWLLILFIWWLLMSFSETYFTWCLLLCHCIQVLLIIH